MPEAGMDRADQLQSPRLGGENGGAGHGLLLQLPAMAGDKARRRQAIVEAQILRRLRQPRIVVEAPVGALRDVADHEAAAAERPPVAGADGHVVVLLGWSAGGVPGR